MGRHRHSRKRTTRRSKITGGDCGAAAWGQSVYGAAGSQHAIGGNDHRIAMNNPGAPLAITKGGAVAALSPSEIGGTPVVVTKGGALAALSPSEIGGKPVVVPTKGGGIVTDVAVPAVLLYARDSIRKKRFLGLPRLSMKRSSHHRRSRRGSRKGRR